MAVSKKVWTTEDAVGSAASTGTYYLYGEQKSGTATNEQYKFATYWRDGESGYDSHINCPAVLWSVYINFSTTPPTGSAQLNPPALFP